MSFHDEYAKQAAQIGISDASLSAYRKEWGDERVVEVLQHAWNRFSLGRLRDPPAWVRSALQGNWVFSAKSPPPVRTSGYRPDPPERKKSRDSADRKWWQNEAQEWRRLMESLGRQRVDELRRVVLDGMSDENLRTVFEKVDPMACDNPNSVRLARLIWQHHMRNRAPMDFKGSGPRHHHAPAPPARSRP